MTPDYHYVCANGFNNCVNDLHPMVNEYNISCYEERNVGKVGLYAKLLFMH